jgi:hypothetical protein
MFLAKLSGAEPQLLKTLEASEVAPPAHPFK